MNSNDRMNLILELVDGKATAAELAQRHGLEEQELLAWRDTWVAGVRAGTRTRAPSRRLWVLGAVVSAAVLGLASKEALAATCAAPAAFSNLGLNYFCPNDPALASEFNANTAQLVAMMQQKLGTGWGLPDAGVSTAGITTAGLTTTNATVTGNLNFGSSVRQMINLWGPNSYGIGVQNGTMYFRTDSSQNFAWYAGGTHNNNAFDPGGGTEAMRLTGTGTLTVPALRVTGLKQTDSTTLTASPAQVERLVVDATPASVGVIVPIDYAAMSAICRDEDGCRFTIAMLNWDTAFSVAHRSGTLFMSQYSNSWRLDNDLQGDDGAGGVTEYGYTDCYFGDFNTSTDTNNGRTDTGLGFGLLNVKGGSYSDSSVTCRIIFRD